VTEERGELVHEQLIRDGALLCSRSFSFRLSLKYASIGADGFSNFPRIVAPAEIYADGEAAFTYYRKFERTHCAG